MIMSITAKYEDKVLHNVHNSFEKNKLHIFSIRKMIEISFDNAVLIPYLRHFVYIAIQPVYSRPMNVKRPKMYMYIE